MTKQTWIFLPLLIWSLSAELLAQSGATIAPTDDAGEISALFNKGATASPDEALKLRLATSIGFIPPSHSQSAVACTVLSLRRHDHTSRRRHRFIAPQACMQDPKGSCTAHFLYFQNYVGRKIAWQCQDPLSPHPGGLVSFTASGPHPIGEVMQIQALTPEPSYEPALAPQTPLLVVAWLPLATLASYDCFYGTKLPDHKFTINCPRDAKQITKGAAIIDPQFAGTLLGIIDHQVLTTDADHVTFNATYVPIID